MAFIDFGRHAHDYATMRPGFPASFYERLAAFIDLNGSRALDLATGPGVVALELAKRGATVTGIDIAPGQIDAARERSTELGLDDRTTFEVCRGEAYEAPPARFDLITAGQCWRWFDPRVMLQRSLDLLKPGGGLVIAHFDYLAPHSDVATRTEDLILEHNPTWTLAGKDGLYPEYIGQVLEAGFKFREQFCYDHLQDFTHAAWRGRIRTCNGVGSGGLPPEGVEAFDAALAEMLRQEFPEEPLQILHRVWGVFATKPARSS